MSCCYGNLWSNVWFYFEAFKNNRNDFFSVFHHQSHWFVMVSHSFFPIISLFNCSPPLFSIYATLPHSSLLSVFCFPLPSSAFQSSTRALSSSFHLNFILPPFLPSSAFVPAVLAYSAGSAPALPIMLAVEKEKEQKTGMREEWKPLVHAGKQNITFAPSERWKTRRTEREG